MVLKKIKLKYQSHFFFAYNTFPFKKKLISFYILKENLYGWSKNNFG